MTDINGTYTLDSTHSRIGFTVRHAMVTKVHGQFNEYESNLVVDSENPAASKATATIKVASVDTQNADRDGHLQSADFFDAENYPEMTFNATSVDKKSESEAVVTGDLTIKGTTKPVSLDVEVAGTAVDPYGNTRLGFEATTKINRRDFGIDFEAPLNAGGMLVGDEIKIEIEGSAIREG